MNMTDDVRLTQIALRRLSGSVNPGWNGATWRMAAGSEKLPEDDADGGRRTAL